uniref:Uncharacterized protein n=1 Tax=Lygus hesperus TaxID=30085 RepID=A0A0A9VU37_LYGHE
MKTMIKMLELQAARRTNTQANSTATASKQPSQFPNSMSAGSSKTEVSNPRQLSVGSSSLKEKDIETQLKEIEKQVKLSVSRTAESRREQAHLMSLINNLEVKMYRTEEAEYIKDVMNKVADELDLEKMKRLQLRDDGEETTGKDIQRLQLEIRAMNNAMANADVIVSESAPIKKSRRVVIREAPEANDESTQLLPNESPLGNPNGEGTFHPQIHLKIPRIHQVVRLRKMTMKEGGNVR